jgi:C1A family cysteine protease
VLVYLWAHTGRMPEINLCGYRKDPEDSRDSDFKSLSDKIKMGAVAGDVDLRQYCTDTNQYEASACAGNATADSVEVLNAIEGKPHVELSRLFIYSLARTKHGELNQDRGTYIRTCFKVLGEFGICPETSWPYDLSKLFVSPSIMAQRNALGHKIHSYYRINGVGQDRVNQVIAALRAGKPVVFGTQITQAFTALTGSVPVGRPSGDTIGGHAMIIVGYVGGNFIIKNSWGQGWGVRGFCFMKPEYIAWSETQDLWVPTLGMAFR